VWRNRDARRRLFDLIFEAGFAGAVDHTGFSLFVLRTALATFLLRPVAFVQGQTLTLNGALKGPITRLSEDSDYSSDGLQPASERRSVEAALRIRRRKPEPRHARSNRRSPICARGGAHSAGESISRHHRFGSTSAWAPCVSSLVRC
jgi:hypothetical protein